MRERSGMAVALRDVPGGAAVVDLACGRCTECLDGCSLWCRGQRGEGVTVLSPLRRGAPALTALLAVAALAEAPPAGVVLVIDDQKGPLAALVRLLRPDSVVVSGDPGATDVRMALAELDPTGRAPLVIATADVRRAVKAVRRGGHVCVPGVAGELPTTTELVQREVTLLGPRSLSRVTGQAAQNDLQAVLDAA